MTNQEILFAGLVGSGIVKQLPRFGVIQNELAKHVLPTLPLFPVKNQPVNVGSSSMPVMDNLWQADKPTAAADQFFPLSFSFTEDGEKWLLPYETMINISGKNIIARRTVAKWKDDGAKGWEGSVKERFSRDDYEIDITGVLIGSQMTGKMEDCFPITDFTTLKDYIVSAKALYVFCDPLNILGITRIVVESFNFPFTKGENVQAYNIKAYSDKSFKLILT